MKKRNVDSQYRLLSSSQVSNMTDKTREDFGLPPLKRPNYSIHGRIVEDQR